MICYSGRAGRWYGRCRRYGDMGEGEILRLWANVWLSPAVLPEEGRVQALQNSAKAGGTHTHTREEAITLLQNSAKAFAPPHTARDRGCGRCNSEDRRQQVGIFSKFRQVSEITKDRRTLRGRFPGLLFSKVEVSGREKIGRIWHDVGRVRRPETLNCSPMRSAVFGEQIVCPHPHARGGAFGEFSKSVPTPARARRRSCCNLDKCPKSNKRSRMRSVSHNRLWLSGQRHYQIWTSVRNR